MQNYNISADAVVSLSTSSTRYKSNPDERGNAVTTVVVKQKHMLSLSTLKSFPKRIMPGVLEELDGKVSIDGRIITI